jgi:hypothetical protein
MTASTLKRQFTYLDSVFEQVCVAVQLTQPQFDDVTQKYGAIGRWLADPASGLYLYDPVIYPQGSMRLGTTIRPWSGEEFDLDIVCQLHYCDGHGPSYVYELVAGRLRDHATYRAILEPKTRCLRINYVGNFHLDIIPACPNGGAAIKIPDRALATWCPSNPVGFADWFFARCQYRRLLLKEASIQPLPSNVPAEHKYPLQRAVQLLKRHRDSFFGGNLDAARSILLTTLAAQAYEGEESLTLALDGIVDGILEFVSAFAGIPEVPNPTKPQENFARGWNSETYPQFVEYLQSLRSHLDQLMQGEGIDKMTKSLGGLVGQSTAERAVLAEARKTEQARSARSLRVEPQTGHLGTAHGIVIPRNNFYGA